MKACKSSRVRILLMGIVLLFIFVLAAGNLIRLKIPFLHLFHGKVSLLGLPDDINTQYTKNFSIKGEFVDLNGLLVRMLDQATCNKTVKLKNGMLSGLVATPVDIPTYSQNIIDFKGDLESQGIEYLYVQAPYKLDAEKQLLPEGLTDIGNEMADDLLSHLQAGGVRNIDLRPTLSATVEQIDQFFLRTDHHWNYTGAFKGFQMILEELQTLFPDKVRDLSRADLSQWEPRKLNCRYLGSQGDRVGEYFAGTEDLLYYLPRFETHLTLTVPDEEIYAEGDFQTVYLRSEHPQEEKAIDRRGYNIYETGDYALLHTHNPEAANNLRILLLKDSYSIPVIGYLSTVFQDVEAIDPRYFQQSGIAEYARYSHPDIVVQMIYPHSIEITEENFWFDTERDFGKDFNRREMLLQGKDVHIDVGDMYALLGVPLQPGQSYVLYCDGVSLLTGDSDAVEIGVVNETKENVYFVSSFAVKPAIDSGADAWFFTAPEDDDGTLQLCLLAGTQKNAANNAAIYRNVRLEALG